MFGQSAASRKQSVALPPTESVLSWGRYPKTAHHRVHKPAWNDRVPEILRAATRGSLLPYGLGGSYGDSCLNDGRKLIDCRRLNRILGFDESTGMLRCESGVSLSDILGVFLPKGWFLPVTPGTRFVTIGGAIANDVHGKNHHRAGTFGCHVLRMGLLRGDGERVEISRETNAELFAATVGGLGLTGIIEWAELKLVAIENSFLDVEFVPYRHLDEFWELAARSGETHECTVAWFDSMARGKVFGRGIFSRANWSAEG